MGAKYRKTETQYVKKEIIPPKTRVQLFKPEDESWMRWRMKCK